MNNKADEKRKKRKTERHREERKKAPAENLPQRILRKVFHERNAELMEPRELYDATVDAVMQAKKPSYQDLVDVIREMMRLDKRAMWAGEIKGDMAIDIGLRYAQEANVLEWAMDEIKAMLRPGNQYGGGR